jgi:type II secretory pathway component PulF
MRGETELSRWTAFLNPLVFLIIGMIGLKVVPGLFVFIMPGAINKGNAALF